MFMMQRNIPSLSMIGGVEKNFLSELPYGIVAMQHA
jgi:hypothetical protein